MPHRGRPKPLSACHEIDSPERRAVKAAKDREDRRPDNHGGDVMSFGLLVADAAIRHEMERVYPALKAAEAFFLGFDDNPYAKEALGKVRQALVRGREVTR